jgi:hypothetical protein
MRPKNETRPPFNLDEEQIRKLAYELVDSLREKLNRDHGRGDWTQATFAALRSFRPDGFKLLDYPSSPRKFKKRLRGEFLWDFIAYQKDEGIFLTVESEWDQKGVRSLKHDFEKLFYVKSPLKLMICKTETIPEAKKIAKVLNKFALEFKHFFPAEVFVLYCRTSKKHSDQADQAFMWQCPGPPPLCGIGPFALERVTPQ